MAGAARIAPPLLIGKLFRLLGADAVVFPNHGGRFGYSPDTCRRSRSAALRRLATDCGPCVPVPAGGMTPTRVPEMLDFYGADIMLLIGGALLAARERLTEETAAFVAAVENYRYRVKRMTHDRPIHRKAHDDYRWEGVESCPYKEDERALFKAVTRQVLFSDPEMARRAALFRGRARRVFDARAPRAHARRADPARTRPLPRRRRGAAARDARSRHRAADDLAPVPRHRRASRSASSAWSTPRATSRNCRRRRSLRVCKRIRRSPRSCAHNGCRIADSIRNNEATPSATRRP